MLVSGAVPRGEAAEPAAFSCLFPLSPPKRISLPQSQHILMSIISRPDASLLITVCSIAVMCRALLRGILSGYLLPQAPKRTDILPKIEPIALRLNAFSFCSQSEGSGSQGLRHSRQLEWAGLLLSFHGACVGHLYPV